MARLVQDVVFKLCAALVAAPLAGNLSWFSILFFALSAALLGWTFVWKEKKKINASVNKTAHAFSLGMGACFTAAHPSSRIPHG